MDELFDSYVVNNIIVFEDGYRLNPNLNPSSYKGSVISDNCYYNCISGLITGTEFNTVPGFSGDDYSDINSFTLSKDSPLIGAGYKMEDDCETDFFGNRIETRNIGCYSGKGTDTPYNRETVFAKILRFIKTLAAMLKNLIEGIKIKNHILSRRTISKDEKQNGTGSKTCSAFYCFMTVPE